MVIFLGKEWIRYVIHKGERYIPHPTNGWVDDDAFVFIQKGKDHCLRKTVDGYLVLECISDEDFEGVEPLLFEHLS